MPSGDDSRSGLSTAPRPGAAIVTRALNLLALALAPLLLVALIHNWNHGEMLAVGLIACQELVIVVALVINRIGRTGLAATIFTCGAWLLIFCLAAFAGEGSRDVALLATAPVLLSAGVLVGRRFLWSLTGLTVAAFILLWSAEHHGWIDVPFNPDADLGSLLDASVIVLMTATATTVLTTDFRRTLEGERRNADALERSELRFRTAIELAADGILLADADARVNEANSRVCGLLGRKRGEVIGRSLFELLPPGKCEQHAESRSRLDRGEVITCERTIQSPGNPGGLVVETTWQRLPDRSLQCFVRDISARRRLEEQLRHAQKMEAVGALAGGIAHDFNNLLTVMQGFLELIEGDPALTAELAAHVVELKNASIHAADLTQQLLAFAGRRPLKQRSVDLRDVLASNRQLISRLVGNTIAVELTTLDTPCPVFVDPGLIAQVLLNLAANARDAMPEGGRFTLAAMSPAARTPPRIGLEGRDVRDYTGICAKDTGVGMEPETARKIFEPFFTTKDSGKGTGLGLAMVHGIVERHGGWVEVESRSGMGTEFSVFLPVHVPTAIATELADATESMDACDRGTILVVDDDPGIRALARDALKPHGFEVIEADSGPDAIEAWQDRGVSLDLIFTDMVMPGGMNGLQLIRACRNRQPDLPAILTSGFAMPPVDPISGPLTDVVLLAKPYAQTVFINTVKHALQSARRRNQRGTEA